MIEHEGESASERRERERLGRVSRGLGECDVDETDTMLSFPGPEQNDALLPLWSPLVPSGPFCPPLYQYNIILTTRSKQIIIDLLALSFQPLVSTGDILILSPALTLFLSYSMPVQRPLRLSRTLRPFNSAPSRLNNIPKPRNIATMSPVEIKDLETLTQAYDARTLKDAKEQKFKADTSLNDRVTIWRGESTVASVLADIRRHYQAQGPLILHAYHVLSSESPSSES